MHVRKRKGLTLEDAVHCIVLNGVLCRWRRWTARVSRIAGAHPNPAPFTLKQANVNSDDNAGTLQISPDGSSAARIRRACRSRITQGRTVAYLSACVRCGDIGPGNSHR
jgi:hypothetical protein